jgi:hypothetical protein
MKNRMRESRSFGSVRDEGREVLVYSEGRLCFVMLSHARLWISNGHPASVVVKNQRLPNIKFSNFSVPSSFEYMDSPCVASGVFASGVRIGLQSIYPASDASVDAGPDDIRSQEPHKGIGVQATA